MNKNFCKLITSAMTVVNCCGFETTKTSFVNAPTTEKKLVVRICIASKKYSLH